MALILPKIDPAQPIAIDLETCDPELKNTTPGYICGVGFVAGIAIAAEEGSWYIPIRHSEGANYNQIEVVDWLTQTLRNDEYEKIFHNMQYDLGWLKHLGVRVRGTVFDTMLAAPLLDENRFSYSLDALGKSYCGEGKFEEALKLAVKNKFQDTRTHKSIIRLRDEFYDYGPFKEAKTRVSPYFELYPDDVKAKYELLGTQKDARGVDLYKLPVTREADVKGLLWAVDPDEMGTYPKQDVDLTMKLYDIFKVELEKEGLTDLMKMECEVAPILLEMREQGVRLDMPKAIELDKKYTRKLDTLQTKVNRIVGKEVNINIDQELVDICTQFNLDYAKTEKGNPSFTADTVPKDEHGIFETILTMRKYVKARDTYIRGYFFGKTLHGKLHGQYNQLKADDSGTVTGRLSSSGPNMQNLPSPQKGEIGCEIRALFLPDTDDEKWLCMDYSGQEPRMLVHTVLNVEEAYGIIEKKSASDGTVTQERVRMLKGSELAETEAFRGRDADFHTAVSSFCMKEDFILQGKEPAGDDFKSAIKKFRPKAKSIGLGVMYGSGDQKVADEMTRKGSPMTKDEAHVIRQSIYNNVPFLKSLNDLLMSKAKSRGYILTILKRRGRFPMWECPVFDKKEKQKIGNTLFGTQEEAQKFYRENRSKYEHLGRPQRAFVYRALNKLIQGSSADQTKMAMLCLYKRNKMDLHSLDIYYRMVPDFNPPKLRIQVHDELNCSIKPDEDPKWYQDTMENCIELKVEVKAEPTVCNNWGEAKD